MRNNRDLLTKRQPKLRFKGFSDDFKNDKILNITSFIKSGATPQSGNKKYYTDNQNGIPFLSIKDMNDKYLWFAEKKITELAINETSTFILEKNNIIFSIYATIGNISINKIDVALPQSILGIKSELMDLEYLYYLFLANKNKIIKFQQIGSQPNLSLEIFSKINLLFSNSKHEQQKIAKFLSLLDKQIELYVSKLKLTEFFFKFYLIKLFKLFDNQSILRFKTFKDKIVNKKLSDFCFVETGKTPSTKNEKFWDGNIKFITPTDIVGKYQNRTKRHLTLEGSKKSKIALKGSILVTCIASIGKNAIAIEDSCFNQQINSLFSKKYNNEYIYYLISRYSKKISSESSKSATQIITKKQFIDLRFYVSLNKLEQDKISAFLSLIDNLKEKIQNQINLLKNKKIYFLNNLFI